MQRDLKTNILLQLRPQNSTLWSNITSKNSEGTIPFAFKGVQTWYKVFGDISGTSRPLVVLHGGPGISHDYMILSATCIASFPEPRAIIFYDQMGNGQSTHLRLKEPTFWTIDLFIDELVNLLSYFRIGDSFDLLGHSWGGILAAEFIIRRQPLVLSTSFLPTRSHRLA
jgi:pimeloyl-ACP methyl ester carboxylesterase